MEKEFVSYNQALRLKELGFDEPCFGSYVFGDELSIKYCEDQFITDSCCLAPTFSQAFRWFREKYNLVIEPCVLFQRLHSTEDDHFEILEFGYRIYSFDQYRGGLRDKVEWDGYDNSNEEKAELACLDKLLEIVEFKTN